MTGAPLPQGNTELTPRHAASPASGSSTPGNSAPGTGASSIWNPPRRARTLTTRDRDGGTPARGEPRVGSPERSVGHVGHDRCGVARGGRVESDASATWRVQITLRFSDSELALVRLAVRLALDLPQSGVCAVTRGEEKPVDICTVITSGRRAPRPRVSAPRAISPTPATCSRGRASWSTTRNPRPPPPSSSSSPRRREKRRNARRASDAQSVHRPVFLFEPRSILA